MKTPYCKLLLILLIAISWIVTDKASGQISSAFGPETDTLYVSNGGGDAPVIGFSAANGNEQISFVSDVKAPISGQHGVLVAGGELILVNQSTCLASFARIRAIENFLKFSAGFGKRDRLRSGSVRFPGDPRPMVEQR